MRCSSTLTVAITQVLGRYLYLVRAFPDEGCTEGWPIFRSTSASFAAMEVVDLSPIPLKVGTGMISDSDSDVLLESGRRPHS